MKNKKTKGCPIHTVYDTKELYEKYMHEKLSCTCHQQPENSALSDFFIKATPEEKKKVIMNVIKGATEDQKKVMEQPEKEECKTCTFEPGSISRIDTSGKCVDCGKVINMFNAEPSREWEERWKN